LLFDRVFLYVFSKPADEILADVVHVQAYLEDFYDFCQTLGDTTAEVMSEALAVSQPLYIVYITCFSY